MGVRGQRHVPAALSPGKKRYPLYRRLGGPQGLLVWVWKIFPPPGFDPRTVQSVVSGYTDRAIPVHRGLEETSILPCIFENQFQTLTQHNDQNCSLDIFIIILNNPTSFNVQGTIFSHCFGLVPT